MLNQTHQQILFMQVPKMMVDFQPDTVIALGGGSAMDAAKGMWMFYEHPDTEFFGAKQKNS